jgi:hypothetical protein
MLRVIFYHVGKGDLSLVLLPDGQAMMVDCYKAHEAAQAELADSDTFLDRVGVHILEHREMIGRTNRVIAEAAAKEKAKTKRIPLAVLAITHADRDHVVSPERLKTHFEIGKLIDSGRDYADPSETQKEYLAYREEMRKADKYIAYKNAQYDIWAATGATVDVLCPNRPIDKSEDSNNQCLILRVAYKGKSFLFTGDSPVDDWANEKTGILKLHDPKVPSDILNVSHHGSRSFFTPPGPRPEGQPDYKKEEYDTRALKRISPALSFITCSDDEDADHPHPIALELYQELTNPNVDLSSRKSHVILSRDSQHLHHVVDTDGRLYMRTSRSRMNTSNQAAPSKGPYLVGTVSSRNGYLDPSGIWVARAPLHIDENVSFSVKAKGVWTGTIAFDWWVLNNGQGQDSYHREYYTMDAKDRKKQSSWSRDLKYDGLHLMQCYACNEDVSCWANWCVLVCYEQSLAYARRWLQIFAGLIDPARIN